MAFGTPCPAQLSSGAEFSGSTTNEFDGEGTTICEYGPDQEIQCNYDTGSGAADSENPSDCPSSIDPQSGSHEHGNDPTTSTTTAPATTSTSTSTPPPPQTSQESGGTTTSSELGETTRTSVATGNTAFTGTAASTSPTLPSPISSGSGALGSSAPAQDLHSTQSTGTGGSSATSQSSPSSSEPPHPDPRSTHRIPASVIAGICVGVAVLLLLCVGCAVMWCRRRRRRRDATAAAVETAEFPAEEFLPAEEPTQMGELPAAFSASTRALLTPSPRPQKIDRDGASGPGHTRESSFAFNHLADDSVVLISSPGSNALTRVLHSKLVTTNAQLNDLLSADASLSARDAAAGWSGPSLAGRRVLIVEEELEAPPSYTR